jgi:hypothetical protein
MPFAEPETALPATIALVIEGNLVQRNLALCWPPNAFDEFSITYKGSFEPDTRLASTRPNRSHFERRFCWHFTGFIGILSDEVFLVATKSQHVRA